MDAALAVAQPCYRCIPTITDGGLRSLRAQMALSPSFDREIQTKLMENLHIHLLSKISKCNSKTSE
jgi:hypothetical protein